MMVSEEGIERYNCPLCTKCFSKRAYLRSHITLHESEKPFRCDFCSKRFVRLHRLNHHKKIHSIDKPHKCLFCGKSFLYESHLKKHATIHLGLKPLKCDICKKNFATNKSLKIHMALHNNNKSISCVVCSKQFVNKIGLRLHMKVHKEKRLDEVCNICAKRFNSKLKLNLHMCTHTGERLFECDICKKGFIRFIVLKKHISDHMKSDKCSTCKAVFTKPEDLYFHMQSHVNKPFQCEICKKSFSKKHYLNKHKAVHENRKYRCNVCLKVFTRKDGLDRHKVNLHLNVKTPTMQQKNEKKDDDFRISLQKALFHPVRLKTTEEKIGKNLANDFQGVYYSCGIVGNNIVVKTELMSEIQNKGCKSLESQDKSNLKKRSVSENCILVSVKKEPEDILDLGWDIEFEAVKQKIKEENLN